MTVPFSTHQPVACLLIQQAARDWSHPPDTHSIRAIWIAGEGATRRVELRQLDSVVEHLETVTGSGRLAAALGLPALMAALTWWSDAPRVRALERRVLRMVWDGRLVAFDVLLDLTRDHRQQWFGPSAHPLDAWSEGSPTNALAWLNVQSTAWCAWSNRLAADPTRAAHAETHARLFGVEVSTIAVALGLLTSWRGVRIDTERLERNLKVLAPAQGPIEGLDQDRRMNLWRNHLDVSLALTDAHRVHPWYASLVGQRLGATAPALQAFTHKGGLLSSRGLISAEPGERLVELDVRQAEMVTLGLVWAARFNDDRYLRDVLATRGRGDGSIHQVVGDLALGDVLDMPDARRAGKLINNALANGGSDDAIRHIVAEALGLDGARRAQEVVERLSDAYPLQEWRDHLGQVGPRGAWATLPHGRSHFVEDGRRYASRMVQTWFADAYVLAGHHLIRAGHPPALLLHDAVLVSAASDVLAENIANDFLAGLNLLLGPRLRGMEGHLRLSVKEFGTTWVPPSTEEDEALE